MGFSTPRGGRAVGGKADGSFCGEALGGGGGCRVFAIADCGMELG